MSLKVTSRAQCPGRSQRNSIILEDLRTSLSRHSTVRYEPAASRPAIHSKSSSPRERRPSPKVW